MIRNNPLFKTIRFRLTLGYVVVLCASIFAVAAFLYHGLAYTLHREVETFLDAEFKHIIPFVADNRDQRSLIINDLNQRTALARGTYELYYALYDREGKILAKSEAFAEHDVSIAKLSAMIAGGVQSAACEYGCVVRGYSDGTVQLVSRPVLRDGAPIYFLQLGVNMRSIDRVFVKYWITICWTVPLVLLVAAIGGYLMAKRYLEPIADITTAAQRVSLSDLSGDLVPVRHTGDELDRLAETFNDVFRKLAVSYRKIAQFTSDASHEMRIPLTTLKGEAAIVLERERNSDEYRRVLESSIEEYDRLIRMLNDLLELSRSDLGESRVALTDVDLSGTVEHLCDFMSALGEAKGVALERSIARAVTVRGNKIMLERLVANLIDNAIKYTVTKSPVRVTLSQNESGAVITVCDRGIGIPKESLARVCDRFYRVDKSRARELGGAGLGLAICKMIVDLHQGTIAIESVEGEGTTVTVKIPVISHKQ